MFVSEDLEQKNNLETRSPYQRVGVIGGGQLAWMMGPAARKLGLELIVQTPNRTDPAVAIASQTLLAAVDDAAATAQLAKQCDVITFENEFVDLPALSALTAQGVLFQPNIAALSPLLDKYDQRTYLQQIGLPTPHFITLETSTDLAQLDAFTFPVVLKTRRHGYDGQGTFVLKTRDDLITLWEKLQFAPVLIEEFVPFERELAIMSARSPVGEVVTYPVVETQQVDQVCRRVFAPVSLPDGLTQEVEAIARTLLNRLEVVGIFGIELFLTPDGRVLVNEIAPRTHNSGHFTLDACVTSQFEQQLRAVCGLPLGDPSLNCAAAVMVNLLGYEKSHSDYVEKRQQLAAQPHTFVHWYGKTESRPGRKLGHVTTLIPASEAHLAPAALREKLDAIAHTLEAIWYPSPSSN